MTAIDLMGPTLGAEGVTTRPTDSRSFGTVDTFFQDCSSATSDDGTEYQAAFFNAVLANLRSVVRANGLSGAGVDIVTQDNTSDSLILTAIQQLIQRGQPTFATDTGTVGHVVAAFTPPVAEHKLGISLRVKIANTNAGAADFAPNGLSAVPITRLGGGALQAGDLQAGGIAELAYDGTQYEVIGLQPYAAASKLRGFTIQQPTLQTLPCAVGTVSHFPASPDYSSLVTSTWASDALTIGAGEDGIWNFYAACGLSQLGTMSNGPYPQPGDCNFASCSIQVNGVTKLSGMTGYIVAGTASEPAVSGPIKLNVGDTVRVINYQQAGGGLSNTYAGTFTGFLISK